MPIESESRNLYRQHLPNGFSFDLIHVKGGSYFFGNSDIEITLPDFYIGQYPVTQALWQMVMVDNPAHFKGKNRPVERISWYDAAAFCNALNALTSYSLAYFQDEKFQEPLVYSMTRPLKYGENIDVFYNSQNPGYRLPSETEWEYAARGGAKHNVYEYAGSDKLEEVGWYKENCHGETKPIGLKAPNELNIYDMNGNLDEWCEDQYIDIENSPQNGAAWIDGGRRSARVLRGGGWNYGAQSCRASDRGQDFPFIRDIDIGFRVVLFPYTALKNNQ